MSATITERLQARHQKRTSQSLTVYRAAVTDAANDQEFSAKRLDELAGVLAELHLTAMDFDADVGVYRTYLAAKSGVEKLPSIEQRDQEEKAHMARVAEIRAEMEKLQRELQAIGPMHLARIQGFIAVEQNLQNITNGNPRLFGTWPPEEPKKPEALRTWDPFEPA